MSLISFIQRVRLSHPPSHPQPLLVHCSAGVGRSGTFIVLDMEMQRIKDMGIVNVFGCVEKLRRQRVQMVQTLVGLLNSTLTLLTVCVVYCLIDHKAYSPPKFNVASIHVRCRC